jgi:hypothetical protein
MNIDRLFVRVRVGIALGVLAALALPGMAQAQETIKIGWL